MYRFFATKSGRLYVTKNKTLFFYTRDDDNRWVWQEVESHTLEDLQAEGRLIGTGSEDDFPVFPRNQFRQQFGHDSRRRILV